MTTFLPADPATAPARRASLRRLFASMTERLEREQAAQSLTVFAPEGVQQTRPKAG
ncbi:hypothetical protein [Deinococcus soli (ex Cha et al. 2016)]|uniref:Uncharacterized protein n=1 Tax=Deinococcus soli (ex Cha et al. 2016) TaxID=1309411 RepID=A0ACC6KLR6_9DEIO|nr:hypothetical protein [Deinococcus soli (ex Cha et al. 2016)]MDR6753470.1 hypothetical protein [Deinococcus soli (ex Cha et al. 2016)]